MRDEVVGLRLARRVPRLREVVRAADEAGVGGARVVRVEGRVDVGGALGRFDVHEAQPAGGVCGAEVDGGLPVRDVEALDFSTGGRSEQGQRWQKRSIFHSRGVQSLKSTRLCEQ